ncbi:MAG: hypothetical protein QOE35_3141 [Actinomycetota bacterium]
MRREVADGTLVVEARRLIETAAVERLGWIRANARTAMAASRHDLATSSAATNSCARYGTRLLTGSRKPR